MLCRTVAGMGERWLGLLWVCHGRDDLEIRVLFMIVPVHESEVVRNTDGIPRKGRPPCIDAQVVEMFMFDAYVYFAERF